MVRCPVCLGRRVTMALGYQFVKCKNCDGKGSLDDIQSNDGKQDDVQNPKKRKRKVTVDKSTTDSIEAIRQEDGERDAVGIGHDDLQEREASGESGEEVRCDESQEVQSSEPVQELISLGDTNG